jgi:hypothetical protein
MCGKNHMAVGRLEIIMLRNWRASTPIAESDSKSCDGRVHFAATPVRCQ